MRGSSLKGDELEQDKTRNLHLDRNQPARSSMEEHAFLSEEERQILIETLIYHYRKDSASCGCGWSKLGYLYAEHVVEVFEESVIRSKE